MIELGNKIYMGVVESRADPLKLGRCKVRVVGIHTENTTVLPTKDLPWAYPMQPITSGAMSGIGHSPTGAVEGTWMVIVFRDEGSFQEPIMLGALGGIPENSDEFSDNFKSKIGSRYDGVKDIEEIEVDSSDDNSQKGFLVDSSGRIVNDSSGNPIRSGSNVLEQSNARNGTSKDGSHVLGAISERYESGGNGSGTINDYNGAAKGDFGGASYGKWQLASYMDKDGPKNGAVRNPPVVDFINTSGYSSQFGGLVPGTNAFDNKWREVAAKDPKGFEAAQHDYIQSKYYSPATNSLRSNGFDMTHKGPAVHDAIWSTSVQYGPGKATRMFERAFAGRDVRTMSDAEIVARIQDDKHNHVKQDFKSSPSLWGNLEKRIASEKAALINLAGSDAEFLPEEIERIREANGGEELAGPPETQSQALANLKPIPSSGITAPRTPESNSEPGFRDPFGKYPRKRWIDEQDVSRLARNEKIDETIMRAKRMTLITRVGSAGGANWSEPKSAYSAVYPLNHVYQSESGHTVEYDDTPDAERIHTYHRSGSFVEYHPDGTVVFKSVKDEFEITVKDRNVYVGGTCNITVMGDTNIYTKGVMNIESDGDMNIKTKSNLRIGAEGSFWLEANREGHVGAGGNLHEGARNILMNCSWKPASVKAGDYAVNDISVTVYDDDEAVEIPEADEAAARSNIARTTGAINMGAPAQSSRNMDDVERAKKDDKPATIRNDPDSNTALSENVMLADLTTSAALTKHAVRDQVGLTKEEIAENLSLVAKNVLEPLSARYGSEYIITSGFRNCSPGQTSQHCKGQAVDIQFPGMPHDEAVHRAEEIARTLPGYDQIIVEYHGRAPVFHISYSADKNRQQKLSTPNLSSYFGGFRDKNMNKVYS